MAKYKCDVCAETEGGSAPCVYENPMVKIGEGEIICPVTGDVAGFIEVEDKRETAATVSRQAVRHAEEIRELQESLVSMINQTIDDEARINELKGTLQRDAVKFGQQKRYINDLEAEITKAKYAVFGFMIKKDETLAEGMRRNYTEFDTLRTELYSRITELEAGLRYAFDNMISCGCSDGIYDRVERILKTLKFAGEKTCQWREDLGEYETSCGHGWMFIDGDLEENNIKFCPFCAKEIVEIKAESEGGE